MKKLFVILLGLVMVLAFTACSTPKDTWGNPQSKKRTQSVK